MDYRSKYNYAAKFVNLVRESTPKITVYTDDAVYRSAQLTCRLAGVLGMLAVSYENLRERTWAEFSTLNMDKLQLTGQNMGRLFNLRSGYVNAVQYCFYQVKQPNLKLETRLKQL